MVSVARLRIRRKPGTRIVLNVKKNCDPIKSLTVPCNVEVTTTNFSSDISTNTTVTTTLSNPSPEKNLYSSPEPQLRSARCGQPIGDTQSYSTPSSLDMKEDVVRSHTPRECLITNNTTMTTSSRTSPISANGKESSATLTPGATPSIKYHQPLQQSEFCDNSNVDIEDDWNLLGTQELSVTSDIVVTYDSKGGTTNHHVKSGKGFKSGKQKVLRLTTSLISPNRDKSTKNYGTCARRDGTHAGNIRESIESKRERKAAKTLAIITGIFVICWLPFFIVALLMPLCGEACSLPDIISSLFLWLGYVNSMLNPVIYTIFSADFRTAFKKILLGKRAVQRMQNRI